MTPIINLTSAREIPLCVIIPLFRFKVFLSIFPKTNLPHIGAHFYALCFFPIATHAMSLVGTGLPSLAPKKSSISRGDSLLLFDRRCQLPVTLIVWLALQG